MGIHITKYKLFPGWQKLITHQLYTPLNAGRQSTYADYTNQIFLHTYLF